jgi:hypothetical protein
MKVVIIRGYREKETLGRLFIFGDVLDWDYNQLLYDCCTIELPNKNNQHDISCIPEGIYDVVKYISPTKGQCFHVLNVPNRDAILIHKGNYATGVKVDTQGCILVGSNFKDINNDGNLDVENSTTTLTDLLELLPDKFKLTIM